ncbi:MAG: hypothetical protein ACFFD4_10720 [Candidatus Odinarchaeota archaeon]
MNDHEAAGIVIGRRALGFGEKLHVQRVKSDLNLSSHRSGNGHDGKRYGRSSMTTS